MKTYSPKKIEKKWQSFWEKEKIFQARDFSKKKKFYVLIEFPYLSGEGLHVGHVRSYTALDVIARKRRMEGFNVLYPIGWDAFGLPTENYAIKTGTPPQEIVKKNVKRFKSQLESIGFSFDWSREINTSDPDYYKWTQWIFIQLYKHGLAYKKKMPINWCPSCKIGLANEEVVNGRCERCGTEVIEKEKEQWMLKITKYADRLISDLDKVDYPERIKISQKEWIGKSKGVEIKFPIAHSQLSIDVFTTRIDTIFGVTYLVLAPEHPIIEKLKDRILNLRFVEDYIEKSKKKLERERILEVKEKSGVKLEGVRAVNPANGEEIPVFVAEYVLPHYGTGAVMAVPAHDERDFEFAKSYDLPIMKVIEPLEDQKRDVEVYTGEGKLINSGRFSGIKSEIARGKIERALEKKRLARRTIHYKLRDWIFSRQRYWGEPIPMIKCEKCGWVPVPEKDLPVKLPAVKKYKPTETGESPLAEIKKWVNVKCPICGGPAKRETDVMPNWAGSNWYYLAYTFWYKLGTQNSKVKSQKENVFKKYKREITYWMPVDWYNGGMEHATLHLLYSRFIYKFLWDIGAVPKSLGPEPYKKRTAHGMVLAKGGVKMSKSKGNVVNPDDVVKDYGADSLRIYEMFMGPFEQATVWDEKGIKGVRRFLEKIWKLQLKITEDKNSKKNKENSQELKILLHKTIKKVSEDIEKMRFNTAISSLMEFCNFWQKSSEGLLKEDFEDFLKILSPFAPHISEEIWYRLGHRKSIFLEKWPKYSPRLVKIKKVQLIIQINGKLRDKVEISAGLSKTEIEKLVLKREKIKKWTRYKKVKKIILVPDKLINIVI